MKIKKHDNNLWYVLNGMNEKESREIARALKFESTNKLKEKFDYDADTHALEAAIRYYGSDWLWHGALGKDWATYEEILKGVAKFQKINYAEDTSIEELEHRIMVSIINKAWKKMNDEERQKYEEEIVEFENEMNRNAPEKLKELLEKLKVRSLQGLTPGTLLSAGLDFKMGAHISFEILVIVMRTLAKAFGIKIAVKNVALYALLTMPVLNIFMGVWLAWDVQKWICGPSMSKIVPAVFLVSTSRIKQKCEVE